MKKTILILGVAIWMANPVKAQFNGELDSTYGTDGISLIDFSNKNQIGTKAKFHPNGKLYFGGSSSQNLKADFLMSRINANGNVDSTFGNNGAITYDISLGGNDHMADMDILPNGKIVMVGVVPNNGNDQVIAVLNPDGSYDTSFNQTGILTTGGPNGDVWENCLAEANGKILVAGRQGDPQQQDVVVARYNPDGTLDASFGLTGKIVTDQSATEVVTAIHRHSANAYYVLAQKSALQFYIMAFDGNGQPISGFGNNGIKTVTVGNNGVHYIHHITSDSQGNLYAMGTYQDKALVYKFTSSGSPDANYGIAGRYLANLSTSLSNDIFYGKIMPNGNLLLAGRSKNTDHNFMTFMLATDGTLIFNYGPGGIQEYGLPLQGNAQNVKLTEDANGKMYVYGTFNKGVNDLDIVVMKLKSVSSTIDISEVGKDNTEISFYPNPTTGLLNIDISEMAGEKVTLKVLDLQGKLVYELTDISPTAIINADLSHLPSGIYLARGFSSQARTTFKVQKL